MSLRALQWLHPRWQSHGERRLVPGHLLRGGRHRVVICRQARTASIGADVVSKGAWSFGPRWHFGPRECRTPWRRRGLGGRRSPCRGRLGPCGLCSPNGGFRLRRRLAPCWIPGAYRGRSPCGGFVCPSGRSAGVRIGGSSDLSLVPDLVRAPRASIGDGSWRVWFDTGLQRSGRARGRRSVRVCTSGGCLVVPMGGLWSNRARSIYRWGTGSHVGSHVRALGFGPSGGMRG